VKNDQGNQMGFVIIVRDLTEKKQTERLLFKSERLAAVGELAGMIGHDLRNPLTGIKNAVYYLKKKGNECTNYQRKEMFETIDNAIAHANKIINELVDYSGEIHLELEECSSRLLVRKALDTTQVPARIKILDCTQNEPIIRVDVDKIVRVFVNIIKNAVDAMPKRGTLEIKSTQTNGNVEIAFADTGTGISDKNLELVFKPLFTTKAQGMGFGLAICKRILEAHGGRITVESTVSKGTTFTVAIPVEKELENGGETECMIPQKFLLSTTTKT
jgi:signal transduction histidine kinase